MRLSPVSTISQLARLVYVYALPDVASILAPDALALCVHPIAAVRVAARPSVRGHRLDRSSWAWQFGSHTTKTRLPGSAQAALALARLAQEPGGTAESSAYANALETLRGMAAAKSYVHRLEYVRSQARPAQRAVPAGCPDAMVRAACFVR